MDIDLAYIAVTPSGYVDGACLINAEDSQDWVSEMQSAGLAIQEVPLAEAKNLLFAQVPQATLEA
jgi:hypothetical protein